MFRTSLLLLQFCVLALTNPLASNKPNWRLYGGSNAAPGAYPFMASFRYRNQHACGGVIVSDRWVITAAHCLDSAISKDLSVLVGTIYLNSTDEGVIHKIHRFFIHPAYVGTFINGNIIVNDIGLIQLTTAIVENDFVKRIAFDTEDTDKPRALTMIGWGKKTPYELAANILQYVEEQTVPFEQCKKKWPGPLIDKQLCVFVSSDVGGSHGDSGDPLVNAAGELTAIYSFGQPNVKTRPDVCTKIAPYISWINENIEKYN